MEIIRTMFRDYLTESEQARIELSLAQAIERFGRENLTLAAARYELSAARAEIIAAGVLPNPRLALVNRAASAENIVSSSLCVS